MLVSALEMRSGIIPGPRLPVIPPLDRYSRYNRRLNHWRRFQRLGDISLIDVSPPLDVTTGLPSTDYVPPTSSLETITPMTTFADLTPMTLPTIEPPAAITNPVPPSPPTATSTVTGFDWAGDVLKLATIAGQTWVGVAAAQRGMLPPGVTGVSPGPQAPIGSRPGAPASTDVLSMLGLGGGSLNTMLIVSGIGLAAVLLLSRRRK